MRKRDLKLTTEQRSELVRMRDHHGTAYLRERAAAMLKISEGMAVYAVAQRGLLRKRKPDTVYAWLRRYEAQGVAGLKQDQRSGKKIPGE